MERLFGLPVTHLSEQHDSGSLHKSLLQPIEEIIGWLKQKPHKKGKTVKNKIKHGNHVLFTGADAAGKINAAARLANETGKDLYRIDLSLLISKYIGETEKNLSQLFDKAEEKSWILFFDEADALFGKRTDVKDSHDKYANQEIAYLLQRIENYEGLAILSSNMKQNIDAAFLRRLRFIVEFPPAKTLKR
jgi:SpoVK/Ycf46/Vps4 family AAA+-type ATPase